MPLLSAPGIHVVHASAVLHTYVHAIGVYNGTHMAVLGCKYIARQMVNGKYIARHIHTCIRFHKVAGVQKGNAETLKPALYSCMKPPALLFTYEDPRNC